VDFKVVYVPNPLASTPRSGGRDQEEEIMKRSLCLAMILCVGVPVVLADRVVLPNRFLDQYGTTFQRTIMAPTGNARSYQMIFDQSQLANVPIGAQITDITYRMSPQYAPWPPYPGVS